MIKSFFEKGFSVLTGEINQKLSRWLFFWFLLTGLLEVIAYQGTAVSFTAGLWLASGILLFIIFLVQCLLFLLRDIKEKRWFILVFSALLFLFYVYITFSVKYSDLNPDAAQQMAAGLNSFEVKGWNYTGQAFLGYANRQYILAAIPALVFGRSIDTLHMGFGYLYLIGLFELLFELRSTLKAKNQNENLALLPIFSMFGFRFILEYYMNFEQAITPVALTLLGVALYMRLIRHLDLIGALALGWIGSLCVNAYTPVLASFGLLVVFLGLRVYELVVTDKSKELVKPLSLRRGQLFTIVGMELSFLLSFAASLSGERADRVNRVRQDVKFFSLAKESVWEFFTDKNAVFFGFLLTIVILYMVLSLSLQLRMYDFLLAVWMICVVIAANYLVGYTSYSKPWIMQRNMIIIPVLVTAVFFAGLRIFNENGLKLKNRSLAIILSAFFICGVVYSRLPHQSFVYFSYIKPMKYMFKYTEELCRDYEIKPEDEFNLVLYTENGFQTNIHDYCTFLYPNAHTYVPEAGIKPQMDLTLPTVVFGENEDFVFLYDGDFKTKDFEDVRYDMTHRWYVVVNK